MSDEYIKKADAIEKLEFHIPLDLLDDIKDIPSEDVTPVIRCKDCRYWTEWGSRTGSCQRSDSVMWLGTDATDFCSFAEREDNETDRR